MIAHDRPSGKPRGRSTRFSAWILSTWLGAFALAASSPAQAQELKARAESAIKQLAARYSAELLTTPYGTPEDALRGELMRLYPGNAAIADCARDQEWEISSCTRESGLCYEASSSYQASKSGQIGAGYLPWFDANVRLAAGSHYGLHFGTLSKASLKSPEKVQLCLETKTTMAAFRIPVSFYRFGFGLIESEKQQASLNIDVSAFFASIRGAANSSKGKTVRTNVSQISAAKFLDFGPSTSLTTYLKGKEIHVVKPAGSAWSHELFVPQQGLDIEKAWIATTGDQFDCQPKEVSGWTVITCGGKVPSTDRDDPNAALWIKRKVAGVERVPIHVHTEVAAYTMECRPAGVGGAKCSVGARTAEDLNLRVICADGLFGPLLPVKFVGGKSGSMYSAVRELTNVCGTSIVGTLQLLAKEDDAAGLLESHLPAPVAAAPPQAPAAASESPPESEPEEPPR